MRIASVWGGEVLFLTLRLRTVALYSALFVLILGTAARVYRSAQPVMGRVERERVVYVLDAGHGGEDGGAVSADGVKESDVNLAITRRLDALLRFLGQDTVLTRGEDVSIYSDGAETLRQKKVSDLKNRVALVNGTPNAVLVSIHQNSMPAAPYVHGAQVFYGGAEAGAALARSVQGSLNRCVNPGNEKTEKQIASTIYLMKHVTCPAILVECGFLSNAEESARLLLPPHQKAIAVSIAGGLLNTEELT